MLFCVAQGIAVFWLSLCLCVTMHEMYAASAVPDLSIQSLRTARTAELGALSLETDIHMLYQW